MQTPYSFSMRISFLMLLSLVVSGCAVGPVYKKPDVPLPASWQAMQPHEGKINTLIGWWDQFHDAALTTLLRAAENDSPTLMQAWARITEARASLTSKQASGWPSVTGQASLIRSSSNVGGGGFGASGVAPSATSTSNSSDTLLSTTQSVAIDASWEIDLFGSVRYATQAAQALVDARMDNWHEARVSLAAEVATTYVNYRACQLQVTYYINDMRSRQETARLIEKAAKAGFSSPSDAALGQASAASASALLINQQAQCDITLKSLVALTGLSEIEVNEVLSKTPAKLPTPSTFSITTLPVTLISQRPDLAAAERALAAASADVGSAEANRYPRLSLTGSISSLQLTTLGSTIHSTPWSFGPALTLPIFDAGLRAANVRAAEARYEQALATYKQAVRNAVKEVEQALVQLSSLTRRENDVRTAAKHYRTVYKATEINWRAGGSSLLFLEDTRRSLIAADMNLITLQRDQIQNWIVLYKALGGGWRERSATPVVDSPASTSLPGEK
ncbi:MAG: efflux transporter outer membrane subunit [Pseudomonadota bacterium]